MMPVIEESAERLAAKLFPNTYKPRHNILLPYYHNVADVNPPHTRYLFDIPSVKKFRADMAFICRHYEPVDLATVISAVESGEAVTKPSFHLTFDDGFRELYDSVAPILLEMGIPATFFVCSGAVDNKMLLTPNIVSLVQAAAAQAGNYPPDFAGQDAAGFQHYVRKLSWGSPAQFKRLTEFYELDAEEYLKTAEPFLTKPQIHSLANQGFSFGSHSHSHPAFQKLALEEVERQIAKSSEFLRDEMQLSCEAFAFPFMDNNVSRDKYAALTANGIRVSFGTSAPKWDSVDFSLQRFSLSARFAHQPVSATLRYLSAKAFSYRLLSRKIMQRPVS